MQAETFHGRYLPQRINTSGGGFKVQQKEGIAIITIKKCYLQLFCCCFAFSQLFR